MFVFLNGEFVPEEQAVISVFDRSFLYGDGLFETMLVFQGKPFRWEQHLERLRQGARFFNIRLPYSEQALTGFVQQLIKQNAPRYSLLRMTLSRGVGVRGYSPKGAESPVLVMSLHPVPLPDFKKPPIWKLITSSVVLPANQPLAQFKTCNKLAQIFARAQADAAGADEALLLNSEGAIVEGSSSNLFWMENEVIGTPPLVAGVLPGVTRAVVLELCGKLGLASREASITPLQLQHAQTVFVSLSSIGLAQGVSLDSSVLSQSPFVNDLWSAYWDLVQKETSEGPSQPAESGIHKENIIG
jgi:branched-chain amino acid aminotransferase